MKIHSLGTNAGVYEQHAILCKCLKAKKVILHTILLGKGGSIYTSHN